MNGSKNVSVTGALEKGCFAEIRNACCSVSSWEQSRHVEQTKTTCEPSAW